MDIVPAPRVIVVEFQSERDLKGDLRFGGFRGAACLEHACILPDVLPPSVLDRMLGHKNPYVPNVEAAYEFVVRNYRAGDYVVMLDAEFDPSTTSEMAVRKIRHAAIRQLAKALDTGTFHKSRRDLAGGRIPIKCIFLRFTCEDPLGWSGVDQLLLGLPSTVENFLCFDGHISGGYSAYAIERGSLGRINRKESWHGSIIYLPTYYWVVLQTTHIIQYDPAVLVHAQFGRGELFSTAIYPNCTKRRRGLPSDDAIPTGGQLVRMAYVDWNTYGGSLRALVWSSQSFAEGEYDDVCSAPLYGPRPS
ncbi:hypothetical protein BDV93DRAFT_528938 [Ceratobasidium sp. AG-I]|nr:hypothetical protein BDV93DRAFT_528938 [Ceratobasidium sp. AG-I]